MFKKKFKNSQAKIFPILIIALVLVVATASYFVFAESLNPELERYTPPYTIGEKCYINYDSYNKIMTDTSCLQFRTEANGVITVNDERYLAFALKGIVGGTEYTYTSMDFNWIWHIEENNGDYIFWAENDNVNFKWIQYYYFYQDPSKSMKIQHYLENNWNNITDMQMYYLTNVLPTDEIEYNETSYLVSNYTDTGLHKQGDFNNISSKINFNAMYDFRFEDLIDSGFNINEFYIGSGSVVGYPSINIIAIGFTKGSGNFPEGTNITIDPTFSSSDVEGLDIAPLDDNKIVVGWCDETTNNLEASVYYTNGTQIGSQITVDAVGGCDIDDNTVAITPLNNSLWVIAYFDEGVDGIFFAVYDNVTQVTSPVSVDSAVGTDGRVDIDAINDTTFWLAYFDDAVNDIIYAKYIYNGTPLISPTTISGQMDNEGDADNVAVATLNETDVVIAWNDDIGNYISFIIPKQIYQEDANATQCGSTDWDLGYSCLDTYDGDWDTYGTSEVGIPPFNAYVLFNYTKPAGALNSSVWKVKDNGGTVNFTIDSDCWSQSPLQFKVNTSAPVWSCWNGSSWRTLRTGVSQERIYEEAMLWYIGTKVNIESITNSQQVSAAAFNSTSFVIGYYQQGDDDMTYATYTFPNISVSGVTDHDPTVGTASSSVSEDIAIINSTSFVQTWYDNIDGDTTFSISHFDGTLYNNQTDADQSIAVKGSAVASEVHSSSVGLCGDNLVVVYIKAINNAVWGAYKPDGTSWDGECEVKWNQSTLNMGESTDNITTTVEIDTFGSHTAVKVDCSGNCTEITTNWTIRSMSDGQTDYVLVTCSNATEGVFQAIFNVTSDEDVSDNLFTVDCEIFTYGWLNVSILKPDDNSNWSQYDSNLTINATVTCEGGSNAKCGTVYALARYNLSADPDTAFSANEGVTPLYLISGSGGEATIILQDADIENLADSEVKNTNFDNSNETNYGTETDFVVGRIYPYGTEDPRYRIYRGYLKFDISQFKDKSDSLISAYLYLKGGNAQGLPYISIYHVYDWVNSTGGNILNETQITWNNQPCGVDFDNSTNCNLTTEDTVMSGGGEWNIYSINNSLSIESKDNISLVSRSDNESVESTNMYVVFYSKESSTSRRPYLNITYISANPQVTTLSQGESWNVSWTLNVTSADTESYLIDVLFNSSYGSGNISENSTADRQVNLNPGGVIPSFSSPAINETGYVFSGMNINHSITISGTPTNYLFSWNASGVNCDTWVNSSWLDISGVSASASNVSAVPSACTDQAIGWIFCANNSGGISCSDVQLYNVSSYGWLNVSISKPDDDSNWSQYDSNLTINATVTCSGGALSLGCGTVYGLARYNLSASPDTAINITEWASPFYTLPTPGSSSEITDLEAYQKKDWHTSCSENIFCGGGIVLCELPSNCDITWGEDIESYCGVGVTSESNSYVISFNISNMIGDNIIEYANLTLTLSNPAGEIDIQHYVVGDFSLCPPSTTYLSEVGSVTAETTIVVNITTFIQNDIDSSREDSTFKFHIDSPNASTQNKNQLDNATITVGYAPKEFENPKNQSLDQGESWNVSWTLNVTTASTESYLIDVFFNSSYGDVSDNNTADRQVNLNPIVDTCTCPGLNENWVVDMSDFCELDDTCDLGTGKLSFINSGYANCSANINTTNLGDPGSSGILYISSSCLIYINV